ncbi:hypothetical protein Dimus_030402 [Dionaea muscipula]
MAPPALPCRRPSLEGDVLTQPRRHRSLVEECRRHFQVALPRLMWSYHSSKHRDLRVRSVVKRSMREGLGSEEEVLKLDLPVFATAEDIRLVGGMPVKARDSIEVVIPDLGVIPSLEAELLPVDGGPISPESALPEGVDLLGGSDSVNGGGVVATIAMGGSSAMAGGAKLPEGVGLDVSPETDLKENVILTDGSDLVKGVGSVVSVSLDRVGSVVSAMDGGPMLEVESDFDGMPEQLPVDGEDRLGSSSASAVFPSPDGAVKIVTTLPAFSPAASACGGAQVKLDAVGHFSRMVGAELGLLAESLVADGGRCGEADLFRVEDSGKLSLPDGGSQPNDGQRQPPLSSAEPVVVVRSGTGVLSAAGQPGYGVATPG